MINKECKKSFRHVRSGSIVKGTMSQHTQTHDNCHSLPFLRSSRLCIEEIVHNLSNTTCIEEVTSGKTIVGSVVRNHTAKLIIILSACMDKMMARN